MSDVDLTRRHDYEEPAPSASDPPDSAVGGSAGGADIPLTPPADHLQYVMGESAAAFERGEWSAGLVNLAHAVFVANRGRPLPDAKAIGLVRKVVGASYHPEVRDDELADALQRESDDNFGMAEQLRVALKAWDAIGGEVRDALDLGLGAMREREGNNTSTPQVGFCATIDQALKKARAAHAQSGAALAASDSVGSGATLDHTYNGNGLGLNLARGQRPETIAGAFKVLYRDEHVAIVSNGEVPDGRWLIHDLGSLERAV